MIYVHIKQRRLSNIVEEEHTIHDKNLFLLIFFWWSFIKCHSIFFSLYPLIIVNNNSIFLDTDFIKMIFWMKPCKFIHLEKHKIFKKYLQPQKYTFPVFRLFLLSPLLSNLSCLSIPHLTIHILSQFRKNFSVPLGQR